MKPSSGKLTRSAVLLAAATTASAQNYFTSPAPSPSPGLMNEALRQKDMNNAAWDVGVQVRVRYEPRDNFWSGANDFKENVATPDNSYWLERVKLHVGYSAKWFSAFVEGRGSYTTGDERDPNPETDGPLDLHQAYFTIGNHKEFPLSLKVGRQELSYGDERLIGAFDWNNLGRVFDAAKVRWQNEWFAADVFASHPVIPQDGKFNVDNDHDYFSGVYATTTRVPKNSVDLYFLARNADRNAAADVPSPQFPQPSARDIYTVGGRIKSQAGQFHGFDYLIDGAYQFGDYADPRLVAGGVSPRLDHSAFMTVVQAGYTFADVWATPRLGLEFDYGSGDSNPTNHTHGTFENLFPTNHKFYGYMDFVSLQNMHDVRLTSSLKPLPRITLLAEAHAFWLADTHDSFYTVAGARRGGLGPTAGNAYGINPGYSNFVGSEIDLVSSYAFSPQGIIEVGYGHFFRGDYIKQSLAAVGSADANWVYLQTRFNF